MSVIFPPVILGPEMAAPVLWAPGIFLVLSAGNPMPIKFLVFFGGGGTAKLIMRLFIYWRSRSYREIKLFLFCRKMSGREVTWWQISIPIFHETL